MTSEINRTVHNSSDRFGMLPGDHPVAFFIINDSGKLSLRTSAQAIQGFKDLPESTRTEILRRMKLLFEELQRELSE